MRVGIVLFNLGGPDSLDTVEPFLENLFSDPAIISLPGIIRRPLAKLIARRRAPIARKIYEELGGRSPILAETQRQAESLKVELGVRGFEAECFIAMRCWHPYASEAVAELDRFRPEHIVLLPLYPQYSTTTGRSSLAEWRSESAKLLANIPAHEICCYPFEDGFIESLTDHLRHGLSRTKPDVEYRVLFSAHGLPKRTIDRGDPYQWQVEQTVDAVVNHLGAGKFDWRICYQSRVGPLEWIGPSTESEIRKAGSESKGLIVVPVAFVSEHSETLVELDIEYLRVARESGVRDYIRVPVAGTHPAFIHGLANLVEEALQSDHPVTCAAAQICPRGRICEQASA